ncbi:hypothetical protein [Photobacterium sanguinicancri]|uniref:3-deoxy-7-phosphoheptulonate synthase n=1 Tax=Photobacterium sanguinicancri TaxID=875932 RepID=A0AAW7Y5I7_9GAMM|nr:hypothetical protein [Photobacterium sanguinicancri]KXI24464.1 3-deoxy-7-phosphoheptulonate synthase [Photobacterium sanguinicancri]MDO6498028.1 hypothetical protein [Photobacterium sanguinicancri]MDO6541999.1 hypothetical protein [Photobacterium sanguinicancri]OZS44772.1 hypothetical protein ASV53_06345 [Photobacterium sanguinicancri]
MEQKVLIADTQAILDAFLDNGLHRDHTIYCQFPHCTKNNDEQRLFEAQYIEFNDGYSCSKNWKML